MATEVPASSATSFKPARREKCTEVIAPWQGLAPGDPHFLIEVGACVLSADPNEEDASPDGRLDGHRVWNGTKTGPLGVPAPFECTTIQPEETGEGYENVYRYDLSTLPRGRQALCLGYALIPPLRAPKGGWGDREGQ